MTLPDGTTVSVPAPKDAATYIYVANDEGGWPGGKPLCTLLYDVTWIEEGITFEFEEMGAGQGMGEKRTVQCIDTHAVIAIDSGKKRTSGYGQTKRFVLVKEVVSREEWLEMTSEVYESQSDGMIVADSEEGVSE